MTLRRVLAVALTVAVLAVAAVVAVNADASGPAAGPRDARREGPLVSAPVPSRGQLGPDLGPDVDRPTSSTAQSKLWFADGSWWGALFSASAQEWRIHWLEWATQQWVDTGTPLDDRPDARLDVLWDGRSLVVVGGGRAEDNTRQAVRVTRYSLPGPDRRWVRDFGFPVTVFPAGATDPTVARDAAGTLWVSAVLGGSPVLSRSSGDDTRWDDPVVVPGATPGVAEHAAVAAYGSGVGVMWVQRGEDAVHVATSPDGGALETWKHELVDVPGRGDDDNALALRAVPAAPDRPASLVAAVQTLPGVADPRNPLRPGLVLVAGGDGEPWRRSKVTALDDGPGSPSLVVDADAGQVVVVTVSRTFPGVLQHKAADLDDLVFPSGTGTQLAAGRAPTSRLQDPTSSKQPVGALSGATFLVADEDQRTYVSGALALGGPDPGTASPGDDPRPAAPSFLDLVVEDFQGGAVGAALDPVWRRRSDDPSGSATVVSTGADGGLAARVVTGGTGLPIAVCRSPGVVGGDMTVDVDVLIEGPGVGGTILTSVRGDREVAGVRVGDRGRAAWYEGPGRVQSEERLAAGRWYRVTTTVHVPTKTWDFVLWDRSTGGIILSRGGLPWRDPRDATVDEVCIGSPDGPGAGTLVDNLRVRR
jgi:hypothetical protein